MVNYLGTLMLVNNMESVFAKCAPRFEIGRQFVPTVCSSYSSLGTSNLLFRPAKAWQDGLHIVVRLEVWFAFVLLVSSKFRQYA